MIPGPDTLIAMAGFALATSASPGPVNIIGAMTGARHGTRAALPFVSGATASFMALFLAFGGGLLAGTGWVLALARPMTVLGAVYLLWLAWRLARMQESSAETGASDTPGFWSGALVQGLNPKAWLVVVSALSTFVLPLEDKGAGLTVFALIFGVICWAALVVWAWGGARLSAGRRRGFTRFMAVILALSVLWMLREGVL